MTRVRLLLLGAGIVAIACLAGCGGSSPTAPPATPPGGPRNETEPNDFNAQSLGALATNNDYVVSGATASGSDVDLYSVSSASTFALFASLEWSAATDLELTISNSSGIFVRHVDTTGHPEVCTVPSLPAGTYTVRVGSLSAAATSYQLTLGTR